ncbi:hypothetical protein JCM15765_38030 [Paradesulfitobacterium aromaticivorans]
MKINLARMQDRFNSLARFGATEQGGLSRLALSNEDKQARDSPAGNEESLSLRWGYY